MDVSRTYPAFSLVDGDLVMTESEVPTGDAFYIDGADLYSSTANYALRDDGHLYNVGRDVTSAPVEVTMVDRTDDPYIGKLSAEITVTKGEIALKASQSALDSLTGRVSSAESSLSVLPGQIALKANQTTVDSLGGRVSAAEASLELIPGKITAAVSSGTSAGVNASAVTIEPTNGLRITQKLSGQQIISYFQANATKFGLYNNDGSAFAEAGIEDGRGYFASSRLKGTGTSFSADIGEISIYNATYYGLRGRNGSAPKFYIAEPGGTAKALAIGPYGGEIYLRTDTKSAAQYAAQGSSGGSCEINMQHDVQPSTGSAVRRILLSGNYYYSSSGSYRGAFLEIDAIERRIYASTAITVESDRRLKRDIEDIEKNLIDYLKPRQYRWISSPERLNYGFIAQEVLEAVQTLGIPMPEIVDMDEDGAMYLEPTQIIPHLVDKVQTQQRQIDALTAKIERLEAIIERMVE